VRIGVGLSSLIGTLDVTAVLGAGAGVNVLTETSGVGLVVTSVVATSQTMTS